MHQNIVPVLIEPVQQRDIADDQHLHGDKLLAGLKHQILQLTVDDPHIGEFSHDGSQDGLEPPVVSAGQQSGHPLPKHGVVDLRPHVLEGGVHIGVHQLDPGEKLHKHTPDGRVEIVNVFLHCRLDVLIAEISCGDDREGGFQFSGNVLFVVICGQTDKPERHEHHAHRQHRHQEEVAQRQGEGGPYQKKKQGQGAHHGKLGGPASHPQNGLCLLDFPAQKGFLFAPCTLINLRPDAFGLTGDSAEHPFSEVHRGDV